MVNIKMGVNIYFYWYCWLFNKFFLSSIYLIVLYSVGVLNDVIVYVIRIVNWYLSWEVLWRDSVIFLEEYVLIKNSFGY